MYEIKDMKRKIIQSKLFPVYKHTTIVDGKKISREIIHRPNVSAIIAFEKEKILVVSQNRFPNGVDIEIPSGTIEKNETPIQAAHREFLEETGYEAKKMIPLTSFYTSIGYSTQKVFCFIDDCDWLDIGRIEDYEIATEQFISQKSKYLK